MAGSVADFGAITETIVFLDYFKDMPDPRQRGKVMYPLDEVLLLCLLAVLAGAETFIGCCQTKANLSPIGWGLSRSCRYLAPFGQCGRTVLLENFPSDEMSVEVEMIEN